jgi:hypothetical protein
MAGSEYIMRSLTDIVSESFIWGVGITKPKESHRRMAAYYITGTLVAAILGVVGVFLFLVHQI